MSQLAQGTWTVNANGHIGKLEVSVDSQGNLNGSIFGNRISGFWDSTGDKITFIRIIDPQNAIKEQVYTGYLIEGGENLNGSGVRPFYLTGSFEAFSGTGAVASRVLYGWYGRISLA